MHPPINPEVVAERMAHRLHEAEEARLAAVPHRRGRDLLDALVADMIARVAVTAVVTSERLSRILAGRADVPAR